MDICHYGSATCHEACYLLFRSHSSSSLCYTLLLALFCSTTLVAIVLRVLLVLCCSWESWELNTFRGCLLEILTNRADCLPWTPISVNRGDQRALKMGLTLLELLPMVVSRICG